MVLCAGSMHSPQILQLSGIGPEAQLRSKDIPVVANLAGVGQNMQVTASLLCGTLQLQLWECMHVV